MTILTGRGDQTEPPLGGWESVADILRQIWADRASLERQMTALFNRGISLEIDGLIVEEDALLEEAQS